MTIDVRGIQKWTVPTTDFTLSKLLVELAEVLVIMLEVQGHMFEQRYISLKEMC